MAVFCFDFMQCVTKYHYDCLCLRSEMNGRNTLQILRLQGTILLSQMSKPKFSTHFSSYSCHPAIPIQTSQIYNQCPMVCLKSHPSFRPTHPVRPQGFPGTDSYPSHGLGLAPKPSHGTTSAPAKQEALKTKMDF